VNSLFNIGAVILTLIAATAIPILLTIVLVQLLRVFAPDEFYALPVLKRAASLAGLVLALALIALDPGFHAFTVGRIFATEGVWSVGFFDLLGDRIFSPAYGLGNLLEEAFWGANRAYQALAVVAAILFATAMALPFVFWRSMTAINMCACLLALSAWSSFVTIYTVSVAAWSLHSLNFWAFAVLGLLYQRYRNRAHSPI